MPYLIEDGIPIPRARGGGRPKLGPRGELGETILRMEPLQSFVAESLVEFQKARAIAMRITGRRFTSRKTRQGWRIWRTE